MTGKERRKEKNKAGYEGWWGRSSACVGNTGLPSRAFVKVIVKIYVKDFKLLQSGKYDLLWSN